MRQKAITFILLCVLILSAQAQAQAQDQTQAQAQNTAASSADEQAATLINTQNWFALEALYPKVQSELSPFVDLLCQAALGSHFNRLPQSCEAIATLLNEHQEVVYGASEGSVAGWLLSMLVGNLQELGAYGQAADLLDQFSAGSEGDDNRANRMIQRWYRTLERRPRTTLSRPEGEVVLPLTLDSVIVVSPLDGASKAAYNFYTEVDINGRKEHFIFDTGCSNASFVSESFAARHNLEAVCDSISASGVGGVGMVRIATTDSMRLGSVTIHNPYFMVFNEGEDSSKIGHINAVLGTDFMRLAGQIELRPKEGVFILPATPATTPASGSNLMHDTTSGQYALHCGINGDDLVTMIFDTGCSGTGLSRNYYLLHREKIERTGIKRETAAGGFGGIVRGTGYDLPQMTFTIGGSSRTLPKVTVNADFDSIVEGNSSGMLGMDLYGQFDRIVFDFGQMFISAE